MPNPDKISRLTLTVKPGERYMIDGVPVEIGRRTGAGVVLMFTLRPDQYVDRLGREPNPGVLRAACAPPARSVCAASDSAHKSAENDSPVPIVS